MDRRMVDLRSDTVTRPTPAMRAAMAAAEVGDDVWGDDPTVLRLQERLAGLLGMEAALFVPSGTQSNLVALLSHCQRGDEYLAADTGHTFLYEGGGAAAFGGIQPHALPTDADGLLDLRRLRAAIKPAGDSHYARTRLLCLENTFHGRALPLSYLRAAVALAREHGLAVHLDGARLFNAALALDEPVAELARGFDTVSVCLSKGLGAPVGSVLCGSTELVDQARRWRKVAGGGMRQVGILAAAGLHALDHHVERLAEDHERAERLAAGLSELKEHGCELLRCDTNMVFLRVAERLLEPLGVELARRGILIELGTPLRLVTHLDVAPGDIERVVAAFREVLREASPASSSHSLR
jgi:threonine aldolase